MELEFARALAAGEWQRWLIVVVACAARWATFSWIVPPLGGRALPATLRMGLAVVLGALAYPRWSAGAHEFLSGPASWLVLLVVKEAVVGAVLGYVTSVVFWGAEAAGWLADTVRGANMAEVLVPQHGHRTTALGALHAQLSIVVFLSMGGHRVLVAAVLSSYDVLPLQTVPAIGGWQEFGWFAARLTGEVFALAVALAAPVVIAVVLTDVALGWINRLAGQVNVFFVAMPLKAFLGVAVVALVLPLLVGILPRALGWAVNYLERGLALLSGP
ncbi:MAG: flagellar biosynthetic protein FliR [Deltaproteobacteria bacterium]|nr:flagellar biosynthetic protein FliR [Deltaproteobacteria bacterium]